MRSRRSAVFICMGSKYLQRTQVVAVLWPDKLYFSLLLNMEIECDVTVQEVYLQSVETLNDRLVDQAHKLVFPCFISELFAMLDCCLCVKIVDELILSTSDTDIVMVNLFHW